MKELRAGLLMMASGVLVVLAGLLLYSRTPKEQEPKKATESPLLSWTQEEIELFGRRVTEFRWPRGKDIILRRPKKATVSVAVGGLDIIATEIVEGDVIKVPTFSSKIVTREWFDLVLRACEPLPKSPWDSKVQPWIAIFDVDRTSLVGMVVSSVPLSPVDNAEPDMPAIAEGSR